LEGVYKIHASKRKRDILFHVVWYTFELFPLYFANGLHDKMGVISSCIIIKKVIKNAIKEKGGMKWYMSLKLKMSRRKGDDMETAEPHFSGKCQTALKMEDVIGSNLFSPLASSVMVSTVPFNALKLQ
jgi:hypothetical protein